jgi:hypothetical protein
MKLTHKQEILATIRGERLDKLPLGVRIDLWYNYNATRNNLPGKYKGWTEVAILKDLDVGFEKIFHDLIKVDYEGVEVKEEVEGWVTTTKFITPVGELQSKTAFNPYEGAHRGYDTEKLFKTEKDYPALKYLIEHTFPVSNSSEYEKARDEIGESGVMMSSPGYCPPQVVMRDLIGYEKFFYEFIDHPKDVEELIELVTILERKKYEMIVKTTDLELIRLGGNWSDDIHTPLFKKYFIPWFQEITDFLHSHGRLTGIHIDGENERLIPYFLDTHIDCFEAWSPYPMTKNTTADLRKALGNKATIWGGVPSTVFNEYSDEEFDAYVKNMFKEIAPGDHFIVGMGDNLPFDGKVEQISRIAELIDKYGSLPINI